MTWTEQHWAYIAATLGIAACVLVGAVAGVLVTGVRMVVERHG